MKKGSMNMMWQNSWNGLERNKRGEKWCNYIKISEMKEIKESNFIKNYNNESCALLGQWMLGGWGWNHVWD